MPDLYGDAGNDRFAFVNLSDSQADAVTRDLIMDFLHGADKIDLNLIDADAITAGTQHFDWLGAGSFSGAAGELHYYQEPGGAITVLEGDVNGDAQADFQIALNGGYDLARSDIIGLNPPVVI